MCWGVCLLLFIVLDVGWVGFGLFLLDVNSVVLICFLCFVYIVTWFAFVYYALVFVWDVLQLFELALTFVCVVYIGYLTVWLVVLAWFICYCLSGWICLLFVGYVIVNFVYWFCLRNSVVSGL